MRSAFRRQGARKQRRSDGTISLDGKRFEVPSRYRHLEYIHLHYAQWDPGGVDMVDERSQTLLCRLFPLDKSANASGLRRVLATATEAVAPPADGIAPLLKQLWLNTPLTGLPPAYIPKESSHA
jgi:putative transposase